MQEIKCPNCGKVFQVDDTGYAQIVQQVRDKEFEKEIARRSPLLLLAWSRKKAIMPSFQRKTLRSQTETE